MCDGEDCGRYRVYELSDITPIDYWSGDSLAPPAGNLIIPLNNMSEAQRNEAITKFRQGLEAKWKTLHIGGDCPDNPDIAGAECICVRTEQTYGEPSEQLTRPWRQRVRLGGPFVIRGTYKMKFQDYLATCHDADETGDQEISWGEGLREKV